MKSLQAEEMWKRAGLIITAKLASKWLCVLSVDIIAGHRIKKLFFKTKSPFASVSDRHRRSCIPNQTKSEQVDTDCASQLTRMTFIRVFDPRLFTGPELLNRASSMTVLSRPAPQDASVMAVITLLTQYKKDSVSRLDHFFREARVPHIS